MVVGYITTYACRAYHRYRCEFLSRLVETVPDLGQMRPCASYSCTPTVITPTVITPTVISPTLITPTVITPTVITLTLINTPPDHASRTVSSYPI